LYGSHAPEENINKKDLVRRYLDGVYVNKGEDNLFPIAVVIDNHPDAYPLVGIAQANLVYEAEVEGNITRYLAFFAGTDEIPEIGPVRSARPYFVDWVNEFSACISHCGGSPAALAIIKKENILGMNEFFQGGYFWRASNRIAPHNVMTSYKNLRAYVEDKSETEGKYFSWQYKDDKPLKERPASTTMIALPEIGVSWEYNKDGNNYTRLLLKQVHKDAQGNAITAKNIVLLYTDMEVIDELLRLEIKTTGTGKAVVCQDGECFSGNWSKRSASARTRFYNEDDEEIEFNAGTTWIHVVSENYNISY
jgi:hypothetical protein